MPRRIPTQVDQSISRMLKGGYLKSQPVSYQTLLSYPPSSIPPRAPFRQVPGDVFPNSLKTSLEETTSQSGRNRLNSAKWSRTRMPKLFPQPIIYLADRVRERFYQDHPWEALRPRTLVEGATVQEAKTISDDVHDLAAWGRNPSPEDVIACTIHLHKKHALSLSQAYHHTLSSYHALRAEHEHASRAAILEAQAYGAVFAVSEDRKPTAAVEIERGYRKESEELRKGAAFFQKTFGSASSSSEALSSVTDSSGAVRVKSATSKYTKGLQYLQAALDTRDGPRVEVAEEENLETFAQSAEIPSDAAEESSAVETPLEESRVEVDVLAGDSQEQGRGGR